MKLVKILVITVLTLSLALGIGIPALANSKNAGPEVAAAVKPENDKAQVKVIKGEVTNKTASSITVGTTLIAVDTNTRYHVPTIKNATLGDITMGMNVIVQARQENGTLLARQVVASPKKPVVVTHRQRDCLRL